MLYSCPWQFCGVLCKHFFLWVAPGYPQSCPGVPGTHFLGKRKLGPRVTHIHYASALCVPLVWLGIRNIHQHITHLPPPVADYCQLVTA